MILLLLTLPFLNACSGEGIWMVYQETGCSDPWRNLDEESTEDKVIQYLKEQGVKVREIEIVNYSSGPFCYACSCPTGNNIRVRVAKSDKDKLIELEFTD